MEIRTLSSSSGAQASATGLRSIPRVNKDNLISMQSSFVFYESSKLVITPVVEPVSLFSIYSASPYAFNIFHNNSISYINRGNYCFADFMIALPHEAFLSPRNLLKKFPRSSCAFTLQSRPQVSEFGFDMLNLFGIEELLIGCNCNVVYSDVYSQKSVRIIGNSNVSGKCDMQEHPVNLFIINNLHSLVRPVKIFPVILWNLYWDINSFVRQSYSYFVRRESKSSSVKVKRHNLFENWFRTFISIDRFKSLRSYSYGIDNILGRKIEFIPSIIIDKMMKLVSVPDIVFKSLIRDVTDCLRIFFYGIYYLIIDWNLEFNGYDGLHTILQHFNLYKLNGGEGSHLQYKHCSFRAY